MNAYILCGGTSRRMKRPKATLLFRDIPLAMHSAMVAEEAGFSPFFIQKDAQNFHFPFPSLVDHQPKTHPLSGILRAMEHSPDELFLILPCDTPFLSPTSLLQLRNCDTPSIAKHSKRHPLIGIYSTKDRIRALQFLEKNLSMREFSADFQTVLFPQEELHNCNHPEDL